MAFEFPAFCNPPPLAGALPEPLVYYDREIVTIDGQKHAVFTARETDCTSVSPVSEPSEPIPVPEPGNMILLLAGAGALFALQRRRRGQMRKLLALVAVVALMVATACTNTQKRRFEEFSEKSCNKVMKYAHLAEWPINMIEKDRPRLALNYSLKEAVHRCEMFRLRQSEMASD